MRRTNWVFLAAIGLIPVGACKHGSEKEEQRKVTVTQGETEVIQATAPEETSTEVTNEEKTEASQMRAVDRYASGNITNSESRYTSAGGDRYASGAGMDRDAAEEEKTTEKYAPEKDAADETSEMYTSESKTTVTPSTPSRSTTGGTMSTTMDTSMGDSDATAKLSATSPSMKATGTVALKETSSGARLMVHLQDAEPGRYAVQILDVGTGSCATLDDINPLGGTAKPSATRDAPKKATSARRILARIDVGQDRMGHLEIDLTKQQLGTKKIDELEQRVLVIREDKPIADIRGTQRTTAPDTAVIACGTIDVEDAG